jgi:hypothetical protein
VRNTGSFLNSSEHRQDVNKVLKLELGLLYVGIPRFYDIFFTRVADLNISLGTLFPFNYFIDLSLARRHRVVIWPNSGFANQLRVWKEINYSVFTTAAINGAERETAAEYEIGKDGSSLLLLKVGQEKQED